MKGQNILKGFLILFSFISFLMLFYITAFAKEDIIEGSIVCVDNDRYGKVNTITKYNSCGGVLVVLGNNSKIYALSGSKSDIAEIEQSPDKIKKLKGQIGGNERAWIFNTSTLKPIEEKQVPHRIKGDLYCLLPDSDNKNIKAIVSNESCSSHEAHAHVVSTKDGEIYTIHGDESKISDLEKTSDRTDVVFKGSLKKNGSELIID
ncbi:MAG: hypothetical protein GWO07_06705 [Candidatus Dadabacteria bacterium]|nr:hypothetical protein [Candidatus Dadabacteria bacterium]NIS08442.1 hypothetical protein [Candidatus Dadabacteria bacterium]NIV42007.1 hypothetical protein [Candidatus Dadabacteria bacterium]NIY21930.1 hypothetical protein [Candidatus Dadabacteria bacterium]